MRDLVLFVHIVIGLALLLLPILILLESKKKSSLLRILAVLTAVLSWVIMIPAGILYLIFYPATKTLIKAGQWPWAHFIVMETKEHWGLLLPIIATVAAGLVFQGKVKESKRWWILLMLLSILLGVMGRMITLGGMTR